MREGHGVGHGKVILLGEHAVVHGQPAIAMALPQEVRATVRLDAAGTSEGLKRAVDAAAAAVGGFEGSTFAVEVEGELPVAVGLGSSAALAVALVRALADLGERRLDAIEVSQAANEVERVFHGTPSGIDATTATREGLLSFEIGPPVRFDLVRPASKPSIVVALSGTRHHTGHTVGGLRSRAEAAPEVYQPVFRAIGDLVRAGRVALESGHWPRLGELMSMNHELLRACGVSTPELDRLVADASACGALGAKLTGAGGGGAAIALAAGDPADLTARLGKRGWEAFAA